MKVFVALSYDRDNSTYVCGATLSRNESQRLVELHRGEILYPAKEAVDGPGGGYLLDDGRGDLVGRVLAFDLDEPVDDNAKTNDSDNHGRLLWMLQRLLNHDDLGCEVSANVKKEVRVVLGMT